MFIIKQGPPVAVVPKTGPKEEVGCYIKATTSAGGQTGQTYTELCVNLLLC